MQLALYCVGKMKGPQADAAKDYAKRIRGLSIVEFKEERLPANPSGADVQKGLALEAARILAKIPPRAYVVLLDKEGEMPSSEQLERQIGRWQHKGSPVVFVIGSSYGVDDTLRERADALLSFSRLTFPHQLMRVILLEQLYRAQTITDGQTYHK